MSVDVEVERFRFETDLKAAPIAPDLRRRFDRYVNSAVRNRFAGWLAAKNDSDAERDAWNQSLAMDLDAQQKDGQA